jgi:hypothetical protein
MKTIIAAFACVVSLMAGHADAAERMNLPVNPEYYTVEADASVSTVPAVNIASTRSQTACNEEYYSSYCEPVASKLEPAVKNIATRPVLQPNAEYYGM